MTSQQKVALNYAIKLIQRTNDDFYKEKDQEMTAADAILELEEIKYILQNLGK